MTYVMSDIHGDFDRYMKMLEEINLDEDKDTLYILGDVIDFGESGMKILMDMSSRPNVYPVIGEHEYTALPLLRRLADGVSESAVAKLGEKALAAFANWAKTAGRQPCANFSPSPPTTANGLSTISANLRPMRRSRSTGSRLSSSTRD